MKDLATVATVKEGTRGVVVSLSGSGLFASGQYALLNTAMARLDQVASALIAQDADKRSVVEGHTDSRGSDAINQPLSVNRANAVRDYLVARGVDPAKISAIGLGSSRPIVDNNTSENRSNNRRVEIVISNGTVTQKALAAGVPVCVVPFGRDQPEVARRVELAGAGTRLPASRLGPERLLGAIRRAIGCKAGVMRIAAAFSAAGPSAAADALEELLPAAQRGRRPAA